jgi:hypothetical protein
MNKVKEITTAWKNVLVGDAEIKAVAEERMAVCQGCEFKIQFFGADVCGECMCPLVAKTCSPLNACPKNKWTR